jgi:tetratricopeptide (TPR) repeat protein
MGTSLAGSKGRNADNVRPLIEAVWHYCQAGQWQEAYNLMLKEGLFSDLSRWGRNVILLELCQLLLPSEIWQPEHSQAARVYLELGSVYDHLGQKQKMTEYYEQELAIRREKADRRGEGETLNTLGKVYDDLDQKQNALVYYEQELAIRREIRDRRRDA